jgi:hypothetical protein
MNLVILRERGGILWSANNCTLPCDWTPSMSIVLSMISSPISSAWMTKSADKQIKVNNPKELMMMMLTCFAEEVSKKNET